MSACFQGRAGWANTSGRCSINSLRGSNVPNETMERLAAFVELLPTDYTMSSNFGMHRGSPSRCSGCLNTRERTSARSICRGSNVRFGSRPGCCTSIPWQRASGTAATTRMARCGSWATRLRDASAGTTEAFVYFNNDIGGFAPRNAATLAQLLSARDGPIRNREGCHGAAASLIEILPFGHRACGG